MIKANLMMLLIIHVLCDFYFQSQKMAEYKRRQFSWVLIHSGLYAIAAIIIFAVVMPGLGWIYPLCFVLLHGIIDIVKYGVCNCRYINNTWLAGKGHFIFITDQLFHIVAILAIVYFIRDYSPNSLYNPQIRNILNVFGISETITLSWMIKILLIHKPANIFISNILSEYRPVRQDDGNSLHKNAGRFIGTLERIIMTILITINQYSAVGLVLTAKSIARYDKISKEQEFAEYYLLGTLLSTICAICVSVAF